MLKETSKEFLEFIYEEKSTNTKRLDYNTCVYWICFPIASLCHLQNGEYTINSRKIIKSVGEGYRDILYTNILYT